MVSAVFRVGMLGVLASDGKLLSSSHHILSDFPTMVCPQKRLVAGEIMVHWGDAVLKQTSEFENFQQR